jgi:hypothetical protein
MSLSNRLDHFINIKPFLTDPNQSMTYDSASKSSSLIDSELSWWGPKALCIYMSHICITAVTTALGHAKSSSRTMEHYCITSYDRLAKCDLHVII